MDASLPGAAAFAKRLRALFPPMKIVATVEDGVCDLSIYDGHRAKPRLRDEASTAAWVDFIGSLSPPPRPARVRR